jgi:hypothetical protein
MSLWVDAKLKGNHVAQDLLCRGISIGLPSIRPSPPTGDRDEFAELSGPVRTYTTLDIYPLEFPVRRSDVFACECKISKAVQL